MNVLSFAMLAQMNEELRSFGIQLNLRDMCGSQLVSIRTLEGEKSSEIPEEVYPLIERFLQSVFMSPHYNETRTSFTV